MSTEILTAIIAAGVAVISAVITIYGQMSIARQQEARSRKAWSQALIAKYRDPLLRSAFDLQNRIYNITKQNFLEAPSIGK